MEVEKTIALVAHDGLKSTLINWCRRHACLLANHQLFATGTTGHLLEQQVGLSVCKLLSGPFGGDQQIGSRIAENRLDILIFFWDPLDSQPHEADVRALLRVAALWNIPVACNEASADFLICSPLVTQSYQQARPELTAAVDPEAAAPAINVQVATPQPRAQSRPVSLARLCDRIGRQTAGIANLGQLDQVSAEAT